MAATSVIGPGTVVRGNVRGDGRLEILGRVEGDVSVSGDVVIGDGAVVRGNVSGDELRVSGTVQGDLRGNDAVLVERGARVVGDLSAPRIGIAPGALVRGTARTDGEAPLAQAQRRAGAVGQALRVVPSPVSPVVTKPAAAPAPKVELPQSPPVVAAEADDAEPVRRERAAAPPPVVPMLGKHAKAKKKRRDA